MILFKPGEKIAKKLKLHFKKEEAKEGVIHPTLTLDSVDISLPKEADSSETIQEVLINGDIAWFFT